jgi:eukaryotic-like serine/threonine-protein kinase
LIRDTDTLALPGKPHAMPADAAGLPVADPFADSRYRVTGRLGRGGSSDVYEAEHLALGKSVVIKVLKIDLADDPMYLDRMRLESQTLARLRHRNLIAVTDSGCTSDGRPFFVMERLQGQTLLAELRSRGSIPVDEAIALVQQLLAGLSAAHDAGIIHRDIKLENLFLCDPDDDGRRTLKILDFGIAKVLPGADVARAPKPLAVKSHEGMPIGTPRFLSPEQVLCLEVSARTDIYGAGTVLYELLTGRDPFFHVDDYLELLEAHVSEAPPTPSAVARQPIDPTLDAIVLRALAKAPELRFQSARAFAEALDAAVAIPQAPVRSGRTRAAPRPRPSLVVSVLVVVGTALLAALIALLIGRAL